MNTHLCAAVPSPSQFWSVVLNHLYVCGRSCFFILLLKATTTAASTAAASAAFVTTATPQLFAVAATRRLGNAKWTTIRPATTRTISSLDFDQLQQQQRDDDDEPPEPVDSVMTTTTTTATTTTTTVDESLARSVFGTKAYWDEVYLGRGDFPADEYSWYYGWNVIGKHVREFLPLPSRSKSTMAASRSTSTTTTTTTTTVIPRLLIPGIGNDSILLDLYNAGYTNLVGQDYSPHAVDRQLDLLSSLDDVNSIRNDNNDRSNDSSSNSGIRLVQGDVTQLPSQWTNRFDAILEKGLLDAVYLSGGDNVHVAVENLRRVLKPNGLVFSISGVVPDDVRRFQLFPSSDWEWLRDGGSDLQAGCFVLRKK